MCEMNLSMSPWCVLSRQKRSVKFLINSVCTNVLRRHKRTCILGLVQFLRIACITALPDFLLSQHFLHLPFLGVCRPQSKQAHHSSCTQKCSSFSLSNVIAQGIRVTTPDLIASSNSSLQYFTHRFKVEINFSEKKVDP